MSEQESAGQESGEKSTTSPDAPHPGEATSPPSNPAADDEAVEKGRENLDQAGGGH